MTSLKSVARRGGTISAAALAALTLAACSAGQITQTSSQVAAVDGKQADSEDDTIALRDVTIILDDDGSAALKFTASNQDPTMTEHTLESVSVDGQDAELGDLEPMGRDCSIVADYEKTLETIPQAENKCIQYISVPLDNDDYGIGGVREVEFVFDNTTLSFEAPVAAPLLPAGELDRDWSEGYTERGQGSVQGGGDHDAEH